MNLADPELELLDPTPNIHNLFVHFDQMFFFATLISRALVRWSKKMYSCAGVCSYEGRNGICDIALSEPLLKLRPRKDLVETLLHEMIHAYLFITNRDNNRDGHGPTFQAHMHRINRAAGLNISIYHDFHEEVEIYQKHWWRCNGICQQMKPYFGVVRRTNNRAPGPSDRWWKYHKSLCSGKFIKIKEPEEQKKPTKVTQKIKANGDITKYINNNNDNVVNKNVTIQVNKAVPSSSKSSITGNLLDNRRKTNSGSDFAKVRDVWKDKILAPSITVSNSKDLVKSNKPTTEPMRNKHKADSVHAQSPPQKIKKIDDYFKTASSILKDVYGKEFIITQSAVNNKLKAITANEGSGCNIVVDKKDSVVCPSCNGMVRSEHINTHLDECLNKDIIAELSKTVVQTNEDGNKLNDGVGTSKYKSVNTENDIKIKTEIANINVTIPKEGSTATETRVVQEKIHPFSTGKDVQTQKCPCCGKRTDKPIELHLNECLGFIELDATIPEKGPSAPDTIVKDGDLSQFNTKIKSEPGTSKDVHIQKCPCCGKTINKPIAIHLDECIGFFDDDTTVPQEGNSTIETIVIDDDEFDETQTFNATGTKSPCPCCLKMVEIAEMNEHLDVCLLN